jgi:hypothetical protein
MLEDTISAPCMAFMVSRNLCSTTDGEKKTCRLHTRHRPPPPSEATDRTDSHRQLAAAAHLMTVGYPRKRRVLDDGHYRDDERVGAADDRRQPGPEEGLQQRVYPRHEQQRLHHPDPVPLQTATPVPKRKGGKKDPKHHISKRTDAAGTEPVLWSRSGRRHGTGSSHRRRPSWEPTLSGSSPPCPAPVCSAGSPV